MKSRSPPPTETKRRPGLKNFCTGKRSATDLQTLTNINIKKAAPPLYCQSSGIIEFCHILFPMSGMKLSYSLFVPEMLLNSKHGRKTVLYFPVKIV